MKLSVIPLGQRNNGFHASVAINYLVKHPGYIMNVTDRRSMNNNSLLHFTFFKIPTAHGMRGGQVLL